MRKSKREKEIRKSELAERRSTKSDHEVKDSYHIKRKKERKRRD